MTRRTSRLHRLLALVASLVSACLTLTSARSADQARILAAFPELLSRHLRQMRPVLDYFSQGPVLIEAVEGDLEEGERIMLYWQDGRFRQEMHWLGFVEVFGWDGEAPTGGADHWYGSDINLPYSLNNGQLPDVTAEYVRCLHYLTPAQRERLGEFTGTAPLNLGERYAIIRYAPPGMSEALLMIDPTDFRLSGCLQGNDRSLSASQLFKLTTFEDWSNFGECYYPAVIRTVTLDSDGQDLREQAVTTLKVARVSPLPKDSFARKSSPQVPSPALAKLPQEVPFSFLSDTVVLTCSDPKGERLRLELDTGANVGLLRSDVVQQLGLDPVGDEEITGHGGVAPVSYVRVEGFKLEGGVEIAPWPAAVLRTEGTAGSESQMEASLEAGGVAGLLGNFLLNSWVVKLDYRRRMMTLYPPDEFDPSKHLGRDVYAIPVTRDSMPFVNVAVDGKIKGGAFFNTGAQQFFTLSTWAIDNANTVYDVESIGTGITVHGYTVFGIIRPKLVTMFGSPLHIQADISDQSQHLDLTFENPMTHLELLAPGEAPNPNRIASFGNAFFQRFTVTFDLHHNMFYIEGA